MIKRISLAIAATAVVATTAFAGGHNGNPAVKARQAHMQLYAFNLGILGGMAQGKVDYDADAASAAASNLAALTSMSLGAYFPEGTDSDSIEGTRALPALWADMPGVMAEATALAEAAAAMEIAAGNGVEAIQGAMGPLGGTCGSCHESYRKAQ